MWFDILCMLLSTNSSQGAGSHFVRVIWVCIVLLYFIIATTSVTFVLSIRSTMSDLKIVEDNLTCPICYELFQNPKCLPCQHTYCEGCLERVQKVSKISCPECRAEASVPAGGVKELPTSFVISRLLDELSLKKKATTEKKYKCGKCNDDVPVVSYCGDCTTFLCQSCRELHQRSKIYGGHHVVPLAEMKDHTPAILANHHSSETSKLIECDKEN